MLQVLKRLGLTGHVENVTRNNSNTNAPPVSNTENLGHLGLENTDEIPTGTSYTMLNNSTLNPTAYFVTQNSSPLPIFGPTQPTAPPLYPRTVIQPTNPNGPPPGFGYYPTQAQQSQPHIPAAHFYSAQTQKAGSLHFTTTPALLGSATVH